MSRIDILLRRPTAINAWLSTPEAKLFVEFLQDWLRAEQLTLKRGTDLAVLARAQGKVEVLERLIGLHDEVVSFQKGIQSGKFKPASESRKEATQ